MKKQIFSEREEFTSILPEYGRRKLLTYADSIRELADSFGYEPVRFMLLQAQYRAQLNYTPEVMESAVASLSRLKNCKSALEN